MCDKSLRTLEDTVQPQLRPLVRPRSRCGIQNQFATATKTP